MLNNSETNFTDLNRMSCNTETQLQILTPTQPIRLRTRLIGVDPNNSVILALGNDKQWIAAKDFINQGQGVIIRIINSDDPEASILAFRSKIKTLLNHAGRWLIMEYPSELQSVALRQHSRIPIFVAASMHKYSEDGYESTPISNGYLQDISIKGGGYTGISLEECKPAQRYYIQVKINNALETLAVPITIKNIQPPSDDSAQHQYGFSMEETDANVEEFVQKVIINHLFQQPKT